MIMKQQLSIGITAATALCMLASFYLESIATHAFITQPPHHNIATTITTTAIDMSSRRGDPYYSQNDYPWENDNDDMPLDYYPQPPPYRYDTSPPPYRREPPFQNNNDNYYNTQRPPQQQYQRPTTRSDNTPSRFQGTAEDFRSGGSPASPLFNTSRQQQQQIPSMQNTNSIYDQQQRYNDYNQPPPMQQRGFNVGETYTEDFRTGGSSSNRRQTPPPIATPPRTRQSSQQYGTNFVKQRLEQYQSNYMDRDRQQYDEENVPRQSSFNNDEQFNYFDDDELQSPPSSNWGSRFDDRIPNSSYQRRSYQRRGDDSYDMPRPPPMNDYEDVDEYRTIERDRYDEPVRQPQPRYESRYDSARSNTRLSNQYQPPPPPVSRDDNMMRNEDTERIYDQWQQERYQADKQQRQRQYDESNTRSRESTRPRYSPNTSTKGYGPGNSFRPQTGFQRGNPPRQTQTPYYPYGPPSRFSNSNGIMGMFDRLMNPYSTFSPSIMMGRLSNSMANSVAQEQQSNKFLLSDASKILSNDVAVKNMLGSSIELGTPFSKTSSSSMVNGVTKSRLELVIPVSGSQNTGRIRLISNQDGIMQIELDVGGRIINVPLDIRSRRYDDAIDADIEDREVY